MEWNVRKKTLRTQLVWPLMSLRATFIGSSHAKALKAQAR
jgi:hypothetical protein